MRLRMLAISLLFFLCSPFAQAARGWAFQSIYVDDVLVYNMSGYNVVTVKMKETGQVNTGCGPTDEHHIVSYWYGGDVTPTIQTWLSLLLSAQAQEFPVNIYVDMNQCGTSAGWNAFGNPEGLGLRFFGVRVVKD